MQHEMKIHWLVMLLAGFILSLFNGQVNAGDNQRPNIVFIIADDLGINDLGCYGRKDHHTPHLDQLAKEGMQFTSAYSAQSVCSPTRAAILTGYTPARLKLTTFLPGRSDAVSQQLLHPAISQKLPGNIVTLPQRLKEAGYVSACIGKWHLGGTGCLPTDRGFNVYHPGQATTKPSATEGGKGEYDLTFQAENFMVANQKRPFFLYLAHNSPHITLAAQENLIVKNQNAFNPVYAAMMETLDVSVGRIMAKIEALGIAENTLVIFTSDNGGLHVLEGGQTPTHNRPFRAGKGFLYEGGIRVPLIVRWPGHIKAGATTSVPVISTDWTPTLLAATGVISKESFDGMNFLELLLNGITHQPRPLYWHQPHYMNQGSRPMGAIRDGAWKLIEHYENGLCELFNLDADLGETTDLSEREPGRVAELRGKLEKWRREVGAQINQPNPDYSAAAWKRLYRDVDVSQLKQEARASAISARLESWRAVMNSVLKNHKTQLSQGVNYLTAKEAKVHGEKLRYEPEPHKDTIGYWANVSDWVEWNFTVPHNGTYEVELLQAAGKNSGGATVEVTVNGQTLTAVIQETGHFQRFVPRTIGTVNLKQGKATLAVHAKTKPGFGVMDLRQVVLRAVP